MSMIDLNIKMPDADLARAQGALDELANKARNPGGGLKIIGEALLKEQNRRFASQTAPDGKMWAALSPLTVLTRGGQTGPILRRRGHLMRSGAWQVSGSTLRVGVNTPYAAVQQFGATIRPKSARHLMIPLGGGQFARAGQVTIPARPMVGFGAKDEKATLRAVAQWLKVDT